MGACLALPRPTLRSWTGIRGRRCVGGVPDIEDKVELRFVKSLGAGPIEVGMHVNENGDKHGWWVEVGRETSAGIMSR